MESSFFITIPNALLILGVLLLVAEIIFFGFATFVLFFIGLSMVLVGALMSTSLIPDDLMTAFMSVAILSFLSAALLWKYLKKLQSNKANKNIEVGLVGYEFELTFSVVPGKSIKHFYSGIEWNVISDKRIEKNTLVRVSKVEVGKLTVSPVI